MLVMPVPLPALVAGLSLAVLSNADPTDWLNSNFLLSLQGKPSANTAQAGAAIIRAASIDSRGGPWSVTDSSIWAPSGNPRDYFSWAPYWWPDCSRCDPSAADDADDHSPALNRLRRRDHHNASSSSYSAHHTPKPHTLLDMHSFHPSDLLVPVAHNMTHAFAASETASTSGAVAFAVKRPAATAASRSRNCPTLSSNAPPAATWTTCTYVQKDGQVNPDVRQLNDSTNANLVSQAAISLAAAYGITGNGAYSQLAAQYIDVFFANAQTGMNPNVNFGQMVRGPGRTDGSFMAILDLRGIVKVVNAVEILRESGAPGWTWDLDGRLVNWAASYINWLKTSRQGQKAGNAANNHGTFFCAQMTALQILIGDLDGARQTLRNFFNGAFKDQLVASGEQPFEAIRTRPAHYRNFNIEGLITNAKLADQLGLDAWTFGSKYGATIQTAVDYALSSYVKAPDASTAPAELAPHVATVMAAYGDPTGKYANWLKRAFPSYNAKAWWLWDQPGAFAMSPYASSHPSRRQKRSKLLLRGRECFQIGGEDYILLAPGPTIPRAPRRRARRAAGPRKLKGWSL